MPRLGRPVTVTPEMIVQGQALRDAGASYATIGEALGVNTSTAHRMLTKDRPTQRGNKRKLPSEGMWALDEGRRRLAIHRRAAKAAREALGVRQ